MEIFYDKDLQGMNTFGMKVSCACAVEYSSVEELREIFEGEAGKGLPRPFFHIGGGSNLLFTGDYPGTILHSSIRFIEVLEGDSTVRVRCGAGVVWDDFCRWCAGQGLWGPENLSLIPGEVGAAAVQNIGAYGREVGEIVERVECYDTMECRLVSFGVGECGYGYRDSIFKRTGKGRYIVTAVVFALSGVHSPELGYGHVREAVSRAAGTGSSGVETAISPMLVREVIMEIRRSKLPDPAETGSAGSFFRNPQVCPETFAGVVRAAQEKGLGEVPHFDMPDGRVKIPAAWLIEKCGWKGYRGENAGVWHNQPLVLVNITGKASPAEIIALETSIAESVRREFGIELLPEVEHVPQTDI